VPSVLTVEALSPLRADPARTAILLDIDGTLAPIVEHAADAHVPEPTKQLVKALANRYGLVACVSGRRASEARAMVSVGTVSYLGAHGAEVLRTGWTEPVLDPQVEDWVRRMQDFGREVESADLRRNRVRIEDKGAILAFHWRGAQDEGSARAAVDAVATRAEAAGLRTHWGRKVLEVRPPVTIDKGSGIVALLDGADIDAALFVGDDRTDLDAFRALAKLADEGRLKHAVGVAVRSEEGPTELASEADFVVEGTSGVRELLELLLAPAAEDPARP
jgi:trehalose 6-phosphate phosphatase